VAVRRWQAFTGGQAVRLTDGRSFEATATARAKPAETNSPTGATL